MSQVWGLSKLSRAFALKAFARALTAFARALKASLWWSSLEIFLEISSFHWSFYWSSQKVTKPKQVHPSRCTFKHQKLVQKLRESSFLPSIATPIRPRPVFLPVAIMFTWKVEDGSECVIKVELRKRKFYHCKRRKGKRYFEKCLKRLRASMAKASSINLFTNVRSKLRYVARPLPRLHSSPWLLSNEKKKYFYCWNICYTTRSRERAKNR